MFVTQMHRLDREPQQNLSQQKDDVQNLFRTATQFVSLSVCVSFRRTAEAKQQDRFPFQPRPNAMERGGPRGTGQGKTQKDSGGVANGGTGCRDECKVRCASVLWRRYIASGQRKLYEKERTGLNRNDELAHRVIKQKQRVDERTRTDWHFKYGRQRS